MSVVDGELLTFGTDPGVITLAINFHLLIMQTVVQYLVIAFCYLSRQLTFNIMTIIFVKHTLKDL